MKMIKKTTAVLASIAAVVAMTACSSDSSSGGGGGSSSLATGGFLKSVGTAIEGSLYDFQPSITDIRMQYLYTASDINGSGYINEIDMTYANSLAADVTCADMLIKMGQTDITDLTTALDTNIEQGKGTFETVATIASHTFPAGDAGTKHTYTLDTPFHYNGVDNLVVEIERAGACDGTLATATTLTTGVMWAAVYNGGTAESGLAHGNMDFTFAGGVNTQIAAGATSSNSFPFNTALKRTQHLFTAADVNGSGPITGIAFQLNAVSVAGDYNATVKLGHTTLAEFDAASNFADNYAATPSIVSDNVQFTIPAGLQIGEWFWVPVNGNFNYNGTDNLIVDVEVTAASATNSVAKVNTGLSNVRAYGDAGADLPVGVDDNAYNMKLRFNGAPMSVVETNLAMYSLPFNSGGSGIQAIYGSQVLGTGAAINSVSMRVATDVVADAVYTDANITIGHTTLSDLTGTLADNMDDPILVFSGDITIPAGTKAGDWITVPVSGFTYDPTKNIVVQLYPGTSSNDVNVYYAGNGVVSNTGAMSPGSTTMDGGFEGTRHPQLQLGLKK